MYMFNGENERKSDTCPKFDSPSSNDSLLLSLVLSWLKHHVNVLDEFFYVLKRTLGSVLDSLSDNILCILIWC